MFVGRSWSQRSKAKTEAIDKKLLVSVALQLKALKAGTSQHEVENLLLILVLDESTI